MHLNVHQQMLQLVLRLAAPLSPKLLVLLHLHQQSPAARRKAAKEDQQQQERHSCQA
jgi:phosphoribosyl 1,2-cyclic phosphodiesterase